MRILNYFRMKLIVTFCLVPWLYGTLGASQLQNFRPVTPVGSYCVAPRWSPNGVLYCSTTDYREILKVNLVNGSLQSVVSGAGCGFEYAFDPEGNIYFKKIVPNGRELWQINQQGELLFFTRSAAMGLPSWYNGSLRIQLMEGLRSFTADGKASESSATGWVYQDGKAIYRVRENTDPQRISPPGMESCLPKISPDGDRVVYEIQNEALILVNLSSGASIPIRFAANACWSPNSRFLLFNRVARTEENAGIADIFMVTCDGDEETNLTESFASSAIHPAISPNQKTVAFESDGRIWIAEFKHKNTQQE